MRYHIKKKESLHSSELTLKSMWKTLLECKMDLGFQNERMVGHRDGAWRSLCCLCFHLLHKLGQAALHFPASFLLSKICVFYLLLVKHFKILN